MLTHTNFNVIIITTNKYITPHLSEAVTPIQLYQLVLDVKSNKIGNRRKGKGKNYDKNRIN